MKVVTSPVMYAKTWNDKIMFWKAKAKVEKNYIEIIKTHGFINGKEINHVENMPITDKNIRELKNYILKMVNKKYNSGYRTLSDLGILSEEDIEQRLQSELQSNKLDANDISKPMKAKPFKVGVIKYPAFAQPKLNGVRCTMRKVEKDNGLFGKSTSVKLLSREGIEYDIPNVEKEGIKLFKSLSDDVVLDGEIYLHNTPVTTISGAARNTANEINKKLRFITFGI